MMLRAEARRDSLNAAKEKLEIVSGAAPPPFRIFAGGIPRRRRRQNAFGLIQEYCTPKPKPRYNGVLVWVTWWAQ